MRERAFHTFHGNRDRFTATIGIGMFMVIFWIIYKTWLSPVFDYYGYLYQPRNPGLLGLAFCLGLLPMAWMPMKLERPSQFLTWMLYLTTYIPCLLVPVMLNPGSPGDDLMLAGLVALGFFIIGMMFQIPLIRVVPIRLPDQLGDRAVIALYVTLNLWMIYTFWGNFRWVAFSEVYSLRADGALFLDASRAGYALVWLQGAVNPYFMARGVTLRRWRWFTAGALGQVLVYMALGNKIAIMSIPFILGVTWMTAEGALKFTRRFIQVNVLVLLGILVLSATGIAEDSQSWSFQLLSLLFMRSYAMPGLLLARYHEFFVSHPLTYLSHVGLVGIFLPYPYPDSLGEQVGALFFSRWNDANANFWATDGIAAFGPLGIVFASVLCAAAFYGLDMLSRPRQTRLTCIALVVAAMNLANTSLFTSLLSGGLFLVMMIVMVAPGEDDPGFLSAELPHPRLRPPNPNLSS